MDLSNVKLIVSDMDGTLLNAKEEVSPLFLKQFERLKALNIHFDVRCVDVAGVYQLSDRFCSRWNLNHFWCDWMDVGRIFAYRIL